MTFEISVNGSNSSEAETEREQFVRENIRLKQRGALPRERGSTKRPYEQSWQYAFENFGLTKKLLTETPLEIRTEPMESDGFRSWRSGARRTTPGCGPNTASTSAATPRS